MGMPCQVNSIVKLSSGKGLPTELILNAVHQATKDEYRIFPIDVPLQLVNEEWNAIGEVVIEQLVWQNRETRLTFRITRIYDAPFPLK